ncbi:fructosamine kinase family protein [Xanthomonas sp. NCPPB 3005]|uniref:fructosamine kinase family protein n=1 Tax=Xanthomonas sp. NCPPB 3005 TaxID=3240913 RepID=UPI003512A1DC
MPTAGSDLFALPPHDGLHRLTLRDGRDAICKRRRAMPADFFAAEVRGLDALRAAGGLRVPQVYAQGEDWLLLEDLGAAVPHPHFARLAGEGLARQHRVRGGHFGFDHDGYIGDSPQDNGADRDGHRFFVERRLRPQAERALRNAALVPADMARLERLCVRLPQLIPTQPPMLLHGDLWQGNLHCAGDGLPALIDAGAAHYGWAEAELAMLTLFGEPDPQLLRSYAEHAPLAKDWRERAPLYNLYHLLNHLNLFGDGYLQAVRAVLARY